MSNIRLFFSEALSLNMIGKLDKSQSHYLNKVMRIGEKKFFHCLKLWRVGGKNSNYKKKYY